MAGLLDLFTNGVPSIFDGLLSSGAVDPNDPAFASLPVATAPPPIAPPAPLPPITAPSAPVVPPVSRFPVLASLAGMLQGGGTSGAPAPAGSFVSRLQAAGSGLNDYIKNNPGAIDALAAGLSSAPNIRSGISNAAAAMPSAHSGDLQLQGRAAVTSYLKDPANMSQLTPPQRALLVANPDLITPYIGSMLGFGGERPMTADEKTKWGIAPNVPAVIDLATNTPKILSSSVNTFSFDGASGSPGAPGAVPAAGGSTDNSRYTQLPDGTQLDRQTGKIITAPVGNNPAAIGANNWPAVDDPGYATAPIAGGLSAAAIDQRALSNLASGTLPPSGRGTTGPIAEQNIAVANRMAAIGGNPALNKADYKALGSSLTQQTEYLNTVQRAFNTANTTLASALDWMKTNGINPSQFPDFNSLQNFASTHGLDVGPVSGFRSQIAQLRAEYAQVLARGGQQTDTVRQEANDIVPDNIAPADLATLAGRLKVDAQNAIAAATQQVAQIRGQLSGAGSQQPVQPPAAAGDDPLGIR